MAPWLPLTGPNNPEFATGMALQAGFRDLVRRFSGECGLPEQWHDSHPCFSVFHVVKRFLKRNGFAYGNIAFDLTSINERTEAMITESGKCARWVCCRRPNPAGGR